MNQYNMGYHLKEGFRSIFTHGLMSFAAVCMIVACLIIMGSFSLVAVNLDNTLGDLEAQNEFTAYVDESLTEEQAKALQGKLERLANVSSATFVDRQAAMDQYVERYADSENKDLFEDLPENTLRHRYRIHVVEIEKMGETVKAVDMFSRLTEVMSGSWRASARSGESGAQTRPLAWVTMKLMASVVANSAAMMRSASFSRPGSSVTMIIRPCRISSTASSTVQN